MSLGSRITEFILWLASWLRDDAVPGFVSLSLVLFLVVAWLWHRFNTQRTLKAFRDAGKAVDASSGPYDNERFIEIQKTFKPWREKPRRDPHRKLADGWREFAETLNRQKGALFNTVRPAEFFDRVTLHMESRFFSQLPSLFVSVGLLLTFLGLVAALDQTREILQTTGSDNVAEGLEKLLSVAGAKFIMSLTGLLCSIVFGFFFRMREGKIDEALHNLCAELERGFEYRTADSHLLDQILETLREQGGHLQTFSTELVAQVARPLREEIPQALRESIQEAMGPSLQQFERGAGQGLEAMVANVTTSMAGSVQEAAQALSQTMEEVGRNLDRVASRLDRSAESMGGQVGNAVSALSALSGEIGSLQAAMAESSREATSNLNEGARSLLVSMEEALQAIRDSSAVGAKGIDQAATAMTEAVEGLTTRLEDASTKAAEASGRTIAGVGEQAAASLETVAKSVSHEMTGMAATVAAQTREVSSSMQEDVLEQIQGLASSIDGLARQMSESTAGVRSYHESVQNGAAAVRQANEALGDSSTILRQVADPIRSAIDRLLASNRAMEQSVTATAKILQSGVGEMTNHTIVILKSTADEMKATQTAVQDSLRAIEAAVQRWGDLAERYDDLDQRLGHAWRQLGENVSGSLQEFRRFEEELNSGFARALSKLQEVVEQVEPFTPTPSATDDNQPSP